jgi:hypothetical protein
MVVNPMNYNLGFTAASLRPELARLIAEHYTATHSWVDTKERVLASNALQCRTSSSAIRLERELRQRLQTLNEDQITLLVEGTADDCAAMAWLAACKYIPFAFEFASEVLREKLALHDQILRNSDYEGYLEGKALLHPEIGRLTPTSRSKLRQVLLRMLQEANVLELGNALGTIHRPVISSKVVRAIVSDDADWLAAFLVPPQQYANAVTK